MTLDLSHLVSNKKLEVALQTHLEEINEARQRGVSLQAIHAELVRQGIIDCKYPWFSRKFKQLTNNPQTKKKAIAPVLPPATTDAGKRPPRFNYPAANKSDDNDLV